MSEHKGKVCTDTIKQLLTRFCKKAYSNDPSNMSDNHYLDICIEMWELDYHCHVMEVDYSICDSYPSRLVVPIYELGAEGEILEDTSPVGFNSKSYKSFSSIVHACTSAHCPPPPLKKLNVHEFLEEVKDHLKGSSIARCRKRLPVPAILCNKKYVARSGTISVVGDVIRKNIIAAVGAAATVVGTAAGAAATAAGAAAISAASAVATAVGVEDATVGVEDAAIGDAATEPVMFEYEGLPYYYDAGLAQDVDANLLKLLNISIILDYMVEKKKIKYMLHVSSSEKLDEHKRYADFKMSVLPYPGCEFYKEFYDHGLESKNLYHDWSHPINDAELSVSNIEEDPIPAKVTDDWANYKKWDLQDMSKHYLKLALMYLVDEESKESGLLVHCISGWDRTPLMTSLIRISLWADGLAHSSLGPKQMLFFTLAYDWYLFGHQLPDRIKRGEFIIYFCFQFLEEIVGESYCMNKLAANEPNHCSESMAVVLDPEAPAEAREGSWPFNSDKENDYLVDALADKGVSGKKSPKANPLTRSPLIEQNKSTDPSTRMRQISGEEISPGNKRATSVSRSRNSSGRKSRESSEEPIVRYYQCQQNAEIDESNKDLDSLSAVSKPVAVSGRKRYDSCSSSHSGLSSFSIVENQYFSPTDTRFFMTDLDDSPSTSRSGNSILVARRQKLMELRRLFFEIFRESYDPNENSPSNAPEVMTDALNKILSTELEQ